MPPAAQTSSTVGYIVGAGAQGRILAEIWQAQTPGLQLHFLDDNSELHGKQTNGVTVHGPLDALATLDFAAARAVLAIGDNRRRLELAALWEKRGVAWGTLVHPAAVLMPSATLGVGTVVFPQALVNTDADVGRHVIVNSGALVEHDSVLEDGCSISPGVSMGGRVHIGRGTFVSAGVTIAPRIRIGSGVIIGAGAVVVDDLPDGILAYGVPARVVRHLRGAADFGRVL
jgi:acetyltransferase EpsM